MGSQGAILIITLWIMAILILFVFGLGFRMSLEARLTDYNATEIKNLYRAKAAVTMLKAVISEDGTEAYDYLGDNWSYNEELFKDIEVGKNGGTFTISYVRAEGPALGFPRLRREASAERRAEKVFYGAMDEESKINIKEIANIAKEEGTALPEICREILLRLFSEADNAGEIVDCILDWIDDGDGSIVRTEGAESDYYETFGDFYYECKNGPLDSIEELLLIKGMRPAIFQTVKDKITVYGEGKVNLNTADPGVLEIMGLHESVVDKIKEEVYGGEESIEGITEYGRFEKVDKSYLLSGLDLGDAAKNSNILDLTGVTSNHFRAHITAKSKDGKIIKEAEAVVSRSGEKSEILSWYEPR